MKRETNVLGIERAVARGMDPLRGLAPKSDFVSSFPLTSARRIAPKIPIDHIVVKHPMVIKAYGNIWIAFAGAKGIS